MSEGKQRLCLGQSTALISSVGWVLGLFVATVVFWKLRIFDSATRHDFALGSFDIYIEHYPMTRYGFEMISSGHIPL